MLIILSSLSLPASGEHEQPFIGVASYSLEDKYISGFMEYLENGAEDLPLVIVDGNDNQAIQNSQIQDFLDSGASAMIINPVDRTVSGAIIDKCHRAGVPLVFINREPLSDDMAKWEKVYYVGALAEEAGRLAAEIFIDYWYSHSEADKNGDGMLQLVMIQGEPGHQDTELRTEYFIETLLSAGIMLDKLHEDTTRWRREEGYDVMASFLNRSGDAIEAVFANNDDLALGAIEALQERGYFNGGDFIPVVGIDGTPTGRKALENGTLLGTVFNDADNQGKAAYRIAKELAEGRVPTEEARGYSITDDRYVWIPYSPLPGKAAEE